MLTLFKSHAGYLHLLNALLRWSSSSLNTWWLEQTVLVLCLRVLITLNFADRWWWLYQCKDKSVCVGFLYTDVRRECVIDHGPLSHWGESGWSEDLGRSSCKDILEATIDWYFTSPVMVLWETITCRVSKEFRSNWVPRGKLTGEAASSRGKGSDSSPWKGKPLHKGQFIWVSSLLRLWRWWFVRAR